MYYQSSFQPIFPFWQNDVVIMTFKETMGMELQSPKNNETRYSIQYQIVIINQTPI